MKTFTAYASLRGARERCSTMHPAHWLDHNNKIPTAELGKRSNAFHETICDSVVETCQFHESLNNKEYKISRFVARKLLLLHGHVLGNMKMQVKGPRAYLEKTRLSFIAYPLF